MSILVSRNLNIATLIGAICSFNLYNLCQIKVGENSVIYAGVISLIF